MLPTTYIYIFLGSGYVLFLGAADASYFFLFNIFNQHKASEMVTYCIEILVEKLIIMKLYRFELLFFDGTVITGKFCVGVPLNNQSIYF